MGRTFNVERVEDDEHNEIGWRVIAPGITVGPLANQQLAIDAAMALAADDDGLVTWSDQYVGQHIARPARHGWFSDEARKIRGSLPIVEELTGSR